MSSYEDSLGVAVLLVYIYNIYRVLPIPLLGSQEEEIAITASGAAFASLRSAGPSHPMHYLPSSCIISPPICNFFVLKQQARRRRVISLAECLSHRPTHRVGP
jgi:hypothetical protein